LQNLRTKLLVLHGAGHTSDDVANDSVVANGTAGGGGPKGAAKLQHYDTIMLLGSCILMIVMGEEYLTDSGGCRTCCTSSIAGLILRKIFVYLTHVRQSREKCHGGLKHLAEQMEMVTLSMAEAHGNGGPRVPATGSNGGHVAFIDQDRAMMTTTDASSDGTLSDVILFRASTHALDDKSEVGFAAPAATVQRDVQSGGTHSHAGGLEYWSKGRPSVRV